jgi:tripartite-type tricarboxylate transporter receptor subunit TctC
VPANTIKDLVTLIRENPGKYSFASPGLGTLSHLLGEQFRVVVGLDLVHAPYGGSGPAITSVVAGHTPIAEAFTMQMKLEMEKWAKAIRAAKIKAK